MEAIVVLEATLHIGQPRVLNGPSPCEPYALVFEDDGETGYVYALDLRQFENAICDALLIYTVRNVVDRDRPTTLQLAWSNDGKKAVVLLNDFPHVVVDFEARRGYCRSGFPPADPTWTQYSHDWDDAALDHFGNTGRPN